MNAIDEISQIIFEFPEDGIKAWEVMRFIYLPRLINSALQDRPHLKLCDPYNGRFIVVGAGPSVRHELPSLSELYKASMVGSLNGSHNWLIKQGLTPTIHPLLEGDIEVIDQALDGPPNKDVIYYLASVSHENIFKQLKDYKVIIWHAAAHVQEYIGALNLLFPNEPTIGGGLTTIFRLIMIGHTLGYRNFDLFGVDSSFDGDSDHIDGYTLADKEPVIPLDVFDEVAGELRRFNTNSQLLMQAHLFLKFIKLYPDFKIKVHGDSLLRCIHRMKCPDIYE